MTDEQAGQSPCRFERVLQQYRVGMPAAEVALPASPAVVRLGQEVVQRFIVRRQWAGSMAGEIRADNSIVFDRCLDPETRRHAIGGRRFDRTPGRMRVKAAPFIKKHSLGTFEQGATGLR